MKGTPLREDELSKFELVEYIPNLKYSFTAGQAYSKYLLALKEGKIIGRKCKKCNRVYVPPRMYCEDCFRPTDEWVEVKDEGEVITVVASFISWTRERLEKPEIIGIIKLEPSRPNDWIFPGIFHRICASYDEVRNMSLFGKKVKAVWKNKNERIGSINDIECFKVIE